MLIPLEILNDFQKAGERLYAVQQSLASIAKSDISAMTADLQEGNTEPLPSVSSQFEALVKITQQLAATEQELRQLYLQALELKAPLAPKRARGRPPLPRGMQRNAKKKQSPPVLVPVPQDVANQRVQEYFKQVLNDQDWTQLKSGDIAKATGLSESAASFAIASAVGSGMVIKKYSRHYMLAKR